MYHTGTPSKLLDPRYVEQVYPNPSRRLAYAARYYAVALPAVLRPHRLHLSKMLTSYRSQFYVTESDQRAWFDLFGVDPGTGRRIPFTYATTAATLTFMHLLGELGVNFKYVRHVRSEMDFGAAPFAINPGHRYTYLAALSDVFAVGSGRVVLELGSHIFDETGQLCAKHTDYFMATDFKKGQLAPLEGAKNTDKRSRFEKVSAYTRQLCGEPIRVQVGPNMGILYGRLSGDMNIVHTTPLAARLMGFPKPFVQGFCTVNLILSQLVTRGVTVQSMQTTFARPVFVGEDVELFYGTEHFELVERRGKVLAYGTVR